MEVKRLTAESTVGRCVRTSREMIFIYWHEGESVIKAFHVQILDLQLYGISIFAFFSLS